MTSTSLTTQDNASEYLRDSFFSMYHDFRFKHFYYSLYQGRSRKIDHCITGFSLLTSASSIVSWSAWSYVPSLLAVLFMIAQTLQVLKSLLPWSAQLSALKYFLPELEALTLEVEHNWHNLQLDRMPEHIDALDLIKNYREQYRTLESKYIGSMSFDEVASVTSAANEKTLKFFKFYFHTGTEGE